MRSQWRRVGKTRVWELWREEVVHSAGWVGGKQPVRKRYRAGGGHDEVQGCKGVGDSHTDTPRRLVNRGPIVPEEANLTSVSEVMSFPAKQQHFLSPSFTLCAPFAFFHFFFLTHLPSVCFTTKLQQLRRKRFKWNEILACIHFISLRFKWISSSRAVWTEDGSSFRAWTVS